MKHLSKINRLALVAILVATGITGYAQWVYETPLHQARAFFATEVIGRKIYVIGGATSRTESTAAMEVYDVDNDSWDTTKASLPVPICAAASAVLNGKIYVIGGKPTYESDAWLNTVYEYDPISDDWRLLPHAMPTPRAFLSACALGTEIYAIGGRTATAFSITTVEKLDPAKGWTTFKSLNAGRSNFTAETLQGKIYVMGGVDAVNPTSVEKYDPAAGATWLLTGENFDRFLHGSTAWGDNIYMIGGASGGSPDPRIDLVWYKPTKGFTTMPCTLQEIKVACGAAVVEDSLADKGGYFFALNGVLTPFFYPTEPGPPVSASVLMYCDTLVSTKGTLTEPEPMWLSQNQPNPFAGQTTIHYELNFPADIQIQVFDLNGRVVASLWDGRQGPGRHAVTWDAGGMPAGVYFYQMKSDVVVLVKKCIVD
ncbi:MAG: T9SS type A sorting domain-containing protein [Saprospirales bacterium]|nr:T9SS type A sorting domain-containing protein [Saprospirales bacterium]